MITYLKNRFAKRKSAKSKHEKQIKAIERFGQIVADSCTMSAFSGNYPVNC